MDQLKIGKRRLNAITNMLSRGTEEAFTKMQMHLVWAGDWTTSALTDEILGEAWFWPNSIPDSDLVPDEAALNARYGAAQANRGLIQHGSTTMPMHYESLLTAQQHELMLQQAFTCDEDEALHQINRIEWKRLVPSLEQWKGVPCHHTALGPNNTPLL